MAQPYDVFISYARGDAERVAIVRDKLTALGLVVFFDAEGIDSGEEFPVVIDRAVKSAKCVLGLWSQKAFVGRWVRIESRIGLDQGKLVAALIDDTRPQDLPAEFYNVNVESLSDFHGQDGHAGWTRVLRAIGKRVGRKDLAPRAAAAAQGAPAHAHATPHNGLMWAIGGAIAAVITLLVFIRASDHPGPAPAAASSEVVPSGPAIPVPKPDDPLPDNSSRNAAPRESAPPAAPQPAAADLSGAWSGYYQQESNRTPFALQISGRPGAFRGRMAEQNTFANPAYPQLFANVAGETRADGAIAFVKTYDGTAGVTHSVQYQGRVDDSGRSVSGVWRLRDSVSGQELSGTFSMQRN